ncbi:MAG: metallophosphoesterase [Ilumatobacteraceae bacterium]
MAILVQISDSHLREAPHTPVDKDPDASLSATVAAVRDIHADLVVLTGDLADDGTIAALSRVRDLVDQLATPCVAVAGNHDDRAHVLAVFGSTDTVDLGAWRLLAVESVIPGKDHGAVDVAALIGRLDRLDDRPTLLAIHHPPTSPSTHPMFQLIGAEQMLTELRARPHVRAVVSGHLHQAFDRLDGDLRVCGAPSSYYAIEHDGNDFRFNADGIVGAQVLTLGDDGSFSCERVARSLGC